MEKKVFHCDPCDTTLILKKKVNELGLTKEDIVEIFIVKNTIYLAYFK